MTGYLDGWNDAQIVVRGQCDIIKMLRNRLLKVCWVMFGAGLFLGGYLALAVERLIK